MYGAANPDLTATLSGLVAGETLATSGITGSGGGSTSATLISPKGSYAITPTVGSLSAQNYAFSAFIDGSLSVTARPLTVTADNVVRLAGESDPNPFKFSVGQGGPGLGGLVNGDAIAGVSIASPAGSAGASGGVVLNLVPSAATFGSGLASNYDINYVDGYLFVLPQPTDLAQDNTDITDPAFFLEVSPEEIASTRTELDNQQAQLFSQPLPLVPLFSPTSSNNPPTAQRDPAQVRRLTQQFGQASQLDSSALLNTMRNEPLVLWHPALPSQLLPLASQDE